MSRQDKPHTHPNFDAPIEVVADPSLSKQEKAETLEDLEQDARQLAIASGEGMSGGEPTALAEVLHAKEALELSSTDFAYELVLKDLEARRLTGDGDAGLIAQAAAGARGSTVRAFGTVRNSVREAMMMERRESSHSYREGTSGPVAWRSQSERGVCQGRAAR